MEDIYSHPNSLWKAAILRVSREKVKRSNPQTSKEASGRNYAKIIL